MNTEEIKNSLIGELNKKGSSIIMHYGAISFEGIKKILDEISELTVIKSLEDSDGILIEQNFSGMKGWRTINVDEQRVTVARLLGV